MARRRKSECSDPHCGLAIHAMGLCEEHYQERQRKSKLHDDAVRLLHRSELDDSYLTNPELRDELRRIQKWWYRTCDSLNFRRTDPILGDEAEHAFSWCIAVAEKIVESERAFRNGTPRSSNHLEYTKEWVYDRLCNLEAGLMSNGVPRRKS